MLSPSDAAAIEACLCAVETRTGAQVVVALVERTDRFHGLRWRAFALATAIAALAVVLADVLRPGWVTSNTPIVASVFIVGAGLACALLASYWPAFERLFLQHSRAHAAVNQRALALFLQRELFATPGRNAVLLLAARFERTLAVIGDTAYRGRVDEADWQRVVDAATTAMGEGNARVAIVAGLEQLESLLVAKGFVAHGMPSNDLPDAPVEIDTSR